MVNSINIMLFLSRFKVLGHSMEPTLNAGDTLIVSSIPYWFKKPQKGNIVLFLETKSKKYFIKRIVKIDRSAQKDKYFLAGDNRNDSKDSKTFGLIERKNILGKVIYKFK